MLIGILLSASVWASEPGVAVSLWRVDAGDFHYFWLPELAGTGAALGAFVVLSGQAPLHPSGEANPSGLDALGGPRWSPTADAWSNFFGDPRSEYGLNVSALSLLGVGVYGGLAHRNVGVGAAYSLVALEGWSLGRLSTEALKIVVSRPRPYTSAAFQAAYPDIYASAAVQDGMSAKGGFDAWKSFPSGHTTCTGGATFAFATLLWRDEEAHGARPWVAAVAYGSAAALTATTGTLRVLAGEHHPTDVLAGGLIGAGFGTGIAWLHTRTLAPALSVSASPRGLGVSGSW